MAYAIFVLSYLGIGVLFLLCYILAFKPQAKDAQLGLIALFWPVFLVIDVVLGFASQIGHTVQSLSAKLKTEDKNA